MGPRTLEEHIHDLRDERDEILREAYDAGVLPSPEEQREIDRLTTEIDKWTGRWEDEASGLTGEELDARDAAERAKEAQQAKDAAAEDDIGDDNADDEDVSDVGDLGSVDGSGLESITGLAGGTGTSGGTAGDGSGSGSGGGGGSGDGDGDGNGSGDDGGSGSGGGDVAEDGADGNPHGSPVPLAHRSAGVAVPGEPGRPVLHRKGGEGDPVADGADDNPHTPDVVVRRSGSPLSHVPPPVHPHSDPRVTDPLDGAAGRDGATG
jgi:hypothetical protein